MPNKGDKVVAAVEGVYSHRGAGTVSAGYHIVKGDNGEVALPPGTPITVVEVYRPTEPEHDWTIVTDRVLGRAWQRRDNGDYLGRHWCRLTSTGLWYGLGEPIGRYTWDEVLKSTENGRCLEVFQYTGKIG